jgi:GT2 family glycosyltransferase
MNRADLPRDPVGPADWSSLVVTVDRLVDDLVAVEGTSTLGAAPAEWGPTAGEDPAAYRRWVVGRHGTDLSLPGRPPTGDLVITVVVRVGMPRPVYLQECLRSLVDQDHRSWELVLHEVGSTDPAVTSVIAQFLNDPRVTMGTSGAPGRTGATPHAAGVPHVDGFVLLLHAEDVLAPGALARLAVHASDDDVDLIYSDEDGLDGSGLPCRPIFKPDWDPELHLAYPYLGDAIAIRRSLLDALGIEVPVTPAGRYDLELRVTEAARVICHVPEVLYHARSPRLSPDGHPEGAGRHVTTGRRALEAAAARRGIDATVEPGARPGWYTLRRVVVGEPTVSVIIPFRDQAGMTRACLDSLVRAPGYPVHEVVLVDNGSTEPETRALRRLLEERPATRVVDFRAPFNWSAINNAAAAGCSGDLLLFLNNDIEARSNGWLHALVEQAQRAEVGAVGARLLYPDGSLQHIGVVLGIQGLAAHLFAGLPRGRTAYLGWDRAVRSWSAVTGACMVVRRQTFEELGGFDEGYPVAFNDVDFCLRLRAAGYGVLATPYAELIHFESVSRGLSGYGGDLQRFLARWGDAVRGDDPCYNPNLSRNDPWCGLRAPDEDEAWCRTVDGLIQPSPVYPSRTPGPAGGA